MQYKSYNHGIKGNKAMERKKEGCSHTWGSPNLPTMHPIPLVFSLLNLLVIVSAGKGQTAATASPGSILATHNGGEVITARRPGSGHHPIGGHHRWGKPPPQQPQPQPQPRQPQPQPLQPKPQPLPQQPKPQPLPQQPKPQPLPQQPKPLPLPLPLPLPPPHQHPHPAKLFGWDPEKAKGMCGSNCANLQYFLLQQEFIIAHNWVRVLYKQPLYIWNEKLATEARLYAMKRAQDCKVIHSDLPYGENIFWGKNLHWGPSDAVYYWYIEEQWFDVGKLKCIAPQDKNCGHFTQIVWKDSMRLGCAVQHCRDPSLGMLIICEYDPPGNYENENPFATNLPTNK